MTHFLSMIDDENFLPKENQSEGIIDRDNAEFFNENFEKNSLLSFDNPFIEFNETNEKIIENINNFIKIKQEKINKKNLLNYCGILDTGKQIILA